MLDSDPAHLDMKGSGQQNLQSMLTKALITSLVSPLTGVGVVRVRCDQVRPPVVPVMLIFYTLDIH